jgi:hypothetical protein
MIAGAGVHFRTAVSKMDTARLLPPLQYKGLGVALNVLNSTVEI